MKRHVNGAVTLVTHGSRLLDADCVMGRSNETDTNTLRSAGCVPAVPGDGAARLWNGGGALGYVDGGVG